METFFTIQLFSRRRQCLNRTMQYGNFFFRASTSSRLRLFKSYYVVWKPFISVVSSSLNIGFKSYYVVWKPAFVYILSPRALQFKSYYVVWKPFRKTQNIVYQQCLNRTMQYGNSKNPIITAIGLFGLNRTMQYGNL